MAKPPKGPTQHIVVEVPRDEFGRPEAIEVRMTHTHKVDLGGMGFLVFLGLVLIAGALIERWP